MNSNIWNEISEETIWSEAFQPLKRLPFLRFSMNIQSQDNYSTAQYVFSSPAIPIAQTLVITARHKEVQDFPILT